jgi:hypothetical protein
VLAVEQQKVATLRAGECSAAASALLAERAWEKAIALLETGDVMSRKNEPER